MLPPHKQTIAQLSFDAVGSLLSEGQARPEIVLERPKQVAHGNIARNIMLQLAKPLGTNPHELAGKIADAIRADVRGQRLVTAMEIADPGLINLRLPAAACADVIATVFVEGDRYGAANTHGGMPVLAEFVSANPTGPLHVGHDHQAVLGDALASLLDWQGHKVHREFYYNDAGVQVHNLAVSARARARDHKPGDANWPETTHNGDYTADTAADYLVGKTVRAPDGEPVTGERDVENIEAIRRFTATYLRSEQDIDLQALGVKFDRYYLESSLYTEGEVRQTIDALVATSKAYEQEGVLWLRTTDDGDDRDRIICKSDDAYTYFVPDVVYHTTKWGRGFTQIINVQGSDHHGIVARVRADLQGLNIGIPKGHPDYALHKMVTMTKDGVEMKILKHAGLYATARDPIEWSNSDAESEAGVDTIRACMEADEPNWPARFTRGRNAVHFFLLSCKADIELVFDVDLVPKQSDENPVYYVQYTHVRTCSVFKCVGADAASLTSAGLAAIASPDVSSQATALVQRLAAFPDVLADVAHEPAPHAVASYLHDLAGDFHAFYNADRVLVDGEAVKRAHLTLLAATRQVLRNGLVVIGAPAPQKMQTRTIWHHTALL